MRGLALAIILVLTTGLAEARAEDGKDSAIQAVIQSQLEAFQRDDGQTAFSFATPIIQQKFGDAERFMQMVRQGYDPVYRPASREFGETRYNAKRAVQKVVFVDRKGKSWLALYFMEQQEDGRWRIGGVRLDPLAEADV